MFNNATQNGVGTAGHGAAPGALYTASPAGVGYSWFKDGVALPSALPRPEHPVLGGTLYVSTMPARGGGKAAKITDHAYSWLREQLPLRAARLALLQDAADHGTERYAKANQVIQRQVKKRRRRVYKACANFPANAAKVQNALNVAIAEPKAELQKLEDEIRGMEYQAMLAYSKVGVPSRELRRVRSATSETRSEVITTPPMGKAGQNSLGSRASLFAVKAILGVILGLLFGENLGLVKKSEFLEFEPASLPWLALSALGGAGIIFGNSWAAFYLWRNAGSSMMEDATTSTTASTRQGELVAWRTIRHALLPTFVVLLILAVEASIFHLAMVSSPMVSDPDSIGHWLAGLPFVLATVIHASATGWQEGKELFREKSQENIKAESVTTFEDSILTSADAQSAFAINDYIEVLKARRQEKLASIDLQSAPYRTLLAVYLAELNLTTELTAEEIMILAQVEEDAVAAQVVYERTHKALEEALEALPSLPSDLQITINQIRVADGAIADKQPPPPAKLSLWQHIIRFFRRLFGLQDKEEGAS